MRIKIIVVSLLLASCSQIAAPKLFVLHPYKIDIQQGNLITPDMRDKISLGMSSAMVRSILGTPLIMDPFHAERWDYEYTMEKAGKPAGSQRLTLFFKDGHLARIDDSHMPAAPAPQAEKKQGAQ